MYFGLLDAGLPDDGTTATAAWLSQLVAASVVTSVINSPTTDTVQFLLPPGFGPHRELLVIVGGVPSNILPFTYAPPSISNLAPSTVGAPSNMLALTIQGSNFCSGTNGCGYVLVDGVQYSAANGSQVMRSYSDSQIVVVMPDPMGANSHIIVVVGGVPLNTVSLGSTSPPSFSPALQLQWVNAPTSGGSSFFVESVSSLAQVSSSQLSVYLGPFLCTSVNTVLDPATASLPAASQIVKVTCTTPPGVGANLAVRIASPSGISAASSFTFSYAAPVITGIIDGPGLTSSCATQANGGGFLTPGTPPGSLAMVQGSNFGTAALVQQLCGYVAAPILLPPFVPCTVAAVAASSPPFVSLTITDAVAGRFADATPSVSAQSDSSLLFAMPAGQGAGIAVTLNIGGQTGTTLGRYALPVVIVNEGVFLGNNISGTTVFISGSNFSNALASSSVSQGLPVVYFGPFGPAQIPSITSTSLVVCCRWAGARTCPSLSRSRARLAL